MSSGGSFLDSIDMLQLRYTELCIEKRQMLNGIEAMRKQISSAQSEIHRLLDLFLEVGPVEHILATDEWDVGETDEVAAGADAVCGEYGFLGDSDEEALMVEDQIEYLNRVSELESEQQQLLQRQKRKRSRSPRRKPAAASPDALPEYPIIVGRAVNRTIIHSLGTLTAQPPVADDPSYQWHPRGYEARRKYIDCFGYGSLVTPKRVIFICRIDPDGMFLVETAESGVIVSGPEPQAIFESLASKYPDPLKTVFLSEFSSLEAFFGLEHDATRRYLRQFGYQ